MNTTVTTIQRPNIVFIESDQHNPAVIGAYGNTVVRTPNLDALAARGIVFDNSYCASPICVPSRMSMLTGQHPYKNEVWTNNNVLNSSLPTFAHSLGVAGYNTVQIGRMHFNGPDQLHGFSERYIGDSNPNHFGAGKPSGDNLPGAWGPMRASLELSGHGMNAAQVHDQAVVDRAVEFIDDYVATDNTEPFCLAIGTLLPHQPFVASKEDFDEYRGKVPPPKVTKAFEDETHPYLQWWKSHTGIEDVTDVEVERARTAYFAMVTRLDALLGIVFDALDRNGILNNTLIVYTADHGEQIGEHGLWWKQTFYEGSVKVPAIISWPAKLPQGVHIDRVTSQLDLNATMLDLAGAPALPSSVGRSLLPVLENPDTPNWDDVAFSEYCTRPNDPLHSPAGKSWQHRMVRKGDWKLIYYHGMPSQLFNLVNDPDELVDLSSVSEYADVVKRLTDMVLDGWDPEWVKSKIRDQSENMKITLPWAVATSPPDTIRFESNPDWNYVDDPQDN